MIVGIQGKKKKGSELYRFEEVLYPGDACECVMCIMTTLDMKKGRSLATIIATLCVSLKRRHNWSMPKLT